MSKKAVIIVLILAMGQFASAKSVGLWKDARSHITDGMLKTLTEADWEPVILTGKDLSNEEKLDTLDVIFLPGGWNAYWFADFNARRALVKYTAGGKGLLAGAFRSGYVRTASRPLFPQVGAVYNRVNGPYVSAFGDSELAKAIDQPFCPGGWDHLVVKVGPLGKVFAINGEDPVGVYGEPYGGRYLIFGAFLGVDAVSNAMHGTDRAVLLTSLEWLDAAPKLSAADKAKHQAQADLDFLRREKIWDWTLNERGPDRGPGVLPQLRNALALQLESRQFTLEYMSAYLAGKQLRTCQTAAKELKQAMAALDENFQKQTTEMLAKINAMSFEELLADSPFANEATVRQRIAEVADKTDQERQAIQSGFFSDPFLPRSVALFLYGGAITETLLPTARKNELIARANKALAELRPAVKAAKAKKIAAEHKQDLATVPSLIAQCASPEGAVRRTATLELGRIGAVKAAPTLIGALQDADEKVRINAILALGWMQAKEAVPTLIKALEDKDLNLRRRAAQALGQIGDPRAVKPLLSMVNTDDCDVAINAILSLGWLKAKDAVPELVTVVTTLDRQDADQRAKMLAAIRALGNIGDASVLATLEKIEAEANDFPIARRRSSKITNVYSTSQSLGLQGHAQLAIEEIKGGGRKEIGVRQADFLATRNTFYRLTKSFNALAGRPSTMKSDFGVEDYWPYLKEAGMTGIHNAWGSSESDPKTYLKALAAAGELDLCWIDTLPADGNVLGGKEAYSQRRTHGVEKPAADFLLAQHANEPAFQGFWYEETYPHPAFTQAAFEVWLKGKHGADYRETLALKADETTFENSPTLMVEFLNYNAELLLESWQESQDWLHGLRKGCAFTYSISELEPAKWPGVTAGAGAVIDSIGPETYQSFGRFNSYFMEMHKDGEARPIMSEFYNWYTPTPAHEIRGFAQHLMHGECFYAFAIHQIFEHGSTYDMWNWDASRWGHAKEIFQKARKIGEYIAVPESAANVGLVLSDLSNLAVNPFNYCGGLGNRWEQNRCALWTALNQSHIPTDVIWAETMTTEKLQRYRALLLADARIVTPEQAQLLREWVTEGGVLIASGATALCDPWGIEQKNYTVADIFGVQYSGFVGVADPDKIDTFRWKKGDTTAVKVESTFNSVEANFHVHRDIKPVKSIGLYKTTEKISPLLPGIASGTACEYDMPLGYDKVTPTSAETLATFDNGDPAVTVNQVGKGACYFWAPIYPGLCYVASEWEMQPNKYDFWPNVRELLTAMIKGGLTHVQATLPVDVTGISKEVEVTVRQQPEKNRMIVHLLNYDTKVDLVKSPTLTIHPPEGKTVARVFYPDTDTAVTFTPSETGTIAALRDLSVHDMVVVEWSR